MKTCKLWASLLLAVALLLPAGFAVSQGRMADIEAAKKQLEAKPNFDNRLRLATLQYHQGIDYLKANDLQNATDSMQASVETLEAGQGMIPETHPAFEEARYGLGYVLLREGKVTREQNEASTRALASGRTAAETRNVLEAFRSLLAEQGLSFRDVVQATVYLADIADYAEMNREYAEDFPTDPPARETGAVSGIVSGARVEISFIAVKPRGR